jgi:hypothetical protein
MDEKSTTIVPAVLAALASVISMLTLPWPVTAVLMAVSGYLFPPAALAEGVLADVLYYSGHGIYGGTIVGAALAVFMFAVRHFVKTRIM